MRNSISQIKTKNSIGSRQVGQNKFEQVFLQNGPTQSDEALHLVNKQWPWIKTKYIVDIFSLDVNTNDEDFNSQNKDVFVLTNLCASEFSN